MAEIVVHSNSYSRVIPTNIEVICAWFMNMQRKADQNTKQCMFFFPKWKPNYRRIPKVALIVNPPIEVQKYPPPPPKKK